ncbi:hypothetical protein JCM10213v2_006213 [Rhodosporidiobolus nylandii]
MAAVASREGGEGEGRREDAGEVKALSPFERLPDELLLAILDLASGQFPWSLRNTAVNKRLHRLAQVVAFRTVDLTRVASACRLKILSTFFEPRLPQPQGSHADILTLKDSALSPGVLSYLPHLRNLTSLTLAGPDEAEYISPPLTFAVSSSLTAALKQLSNLSTLSLSFLPHLHFEDTSFRLSANLPQVHALSVSEAYLADPGYMQLLSDISRIEHLSFSGTFEGADLYCLLPWAHLRTLELRASAEKLLPDGDTFLKSFESAIYPEPGGGTHILPLQSLTLGTKALGYHDNSFDESSELGSESLTALFRLLSVQQLKHLELEYPRHEILWVDRDASVPSLEVLTLEGRSAGRLETNDLPGLSTLIGVFPNLRESTRRKSATGHGWVAICYPALFALVGFLRHRSAVLSVSWTRWLWDVEMRWTRGTSEEEFKVERYGYADWVAGPGYGGHSPQSPPIF